MMKKYMALALGVILGLVLLVACATTTNTGTTYPSSCVKQADGTWNSVILNKIPDPQSVDIMLQLANLEAIKQDVWTKDQAEQLLTWIETQLTLPDITFSTLIAQVLPMVTQLNNVAGAEVYLISQYVTALNVPLPISACDKELIRAHLAKQRTILLLAGASSTQGNQAIKPTLKRP
jgi:hypothetical protein